SFPFRNCTKLFPSFAVSGIHQRHDWVTRIHAESIQRVGNCTSRIRNPTASPSLSPTRSHPVGGCDPLWSFRRHTDQSLPSSHADRVGPSRTECLVRPANGSRQGHHGLESRHGAVLSE